MQSAGPATPTLLELPSAADHALAQRRDEGTTLFESTASSRCLFNYFSALARRTARTRHDPAPSPTLKRLPSPARQLTGQDQASAASDSTTVQNPPRLVLSCTALRTSPTSGILKEVTRAIPHPLSATTCSFAHPSSVCSETTSTSSCSPPRRLSSCAREMKSAVRTDRSNPSMLASCGRETSNFRHIARSASRERR